MATQPLKCDRWRVGIETGEFTELLGGVRVGEPVAVEGSHILKSEAQRSAAPDIQVSVR